MSAREKPLITDLPQLEILEVEEPTVDRLEELREIFNYTTPSNTSEEPSDRWRWN